MKAPPDINIVCENGEMILASRFYILKARQCTKLKFLTVNKAIFQVVSVFIQPIIDRVGERLYIFS